MKKSVGFALATAAVLSAAAAQADTIAYNSTPAPPWVYGTGNGYAPANTAVLTTNDGSALALRLHQTGQVAPASDGSGVYSFALAPNTFQLSFDWGIFGPDLQSLKSLLTITNIGTGASNSYDPFFSGNDNTNGTGFAQNSYRLNWAGIGFDASVDDTYKVNLTVAGLDGGVKSLDVYAKVGAGAVPEPATWAMMIVGIGAVGVSLRRKNVRRSVSFA